ncbi:MAG TPA: hypothetical protein VIY48_09990 [Candidatus Paceibacterota bacterium]
MPEEAMRIYSGQPDLWGNITPVSLMLPPKLNYAEWERLLYNLLTMEGGVKWYIGDVLNYGDREYGEMYTQALNATHYTYQQLANMKYVARLFPVEWRIEGVKWEIYEVLAPLMRVSPEATKEILKRAAEEHLNKTEVAYDARVARQELAGKRPQVPTDVWSHIAYSHGPGPSQNGVEQPTQVIAPQPQAKPEWAQELLEMVLAFADADPGSGAMYEAHSRAVEWVIKHGLDGRWKGE